MWLCYEGPGPQDGNSLDASTSSAPLGSDPLDTLCRLRGLSLSLRPKGSTCTPLTIKSLMKAQLQKGPPTVLQAHLLLGFCPEPLWPRWAYSHIPAP